MSQDDEEKALRAVALQNVQSILQARQRAEQELLNTKEVLEQQTRILERLNEAGATQLRASEERYRRMVENMSEGVWMYDAQGITTFVNARMAEMLGCSAEEAVGQPTVALLVGSNLAPTQEQIMRPFHGSLKRSDFRLRRKDGTELRTSIQANSLFDDEGRFEAALALVTDVTSQRRADETRARLAAIVESSDDAILSTSLDGAITSWNLGAEKLYQYASAEVVGEPASLLVPHEINDEERAILERAMHGEAKRSVETRRRRKDGTLVDVALTISPILDVDGTVTGASVIARDLTARRQAEAALRRAEEQFRQAHKMEAIGNLAGGVAHDFNNLLSVILSYTTLILEGLNPSDPLHVDLEEVHKAGMRATALTRQLLAFSRQQILQTSVLELNHVVLGIQKMLGRVLTKDIELSLLMSTVAGKIHADPGQIEQIIMNLVLNARDAMPKGGSLTIETANIVLDEEYVRTHAGVRPGAYVMLAVSDTGTGMDGATQERIFDPFFTTKDKSKGTGLGLSTVYGIVQQSGGHVWVYSELGKGATFKVYLPRTDRAVASAPPSPAASTLDGTETILLVEDEEPVRTIIRTILRRNGYHVLETQNAGEAFLLCEQFTAKIHLLLTDIVMPRMSGRELAARLVSMRHDLKVLYVSGYAENAIVSHGIFDSGIEFLQKPIMPEPLLRKVRQVLDSQANGTEISK